MLHFKNINKSELYKMEIRHKTISIDRSFIADYAYKRTFLDSYTSDYRPSDGKYLYDSFYHSFRDKDYLKCIRVLDNIDNYRQSDKDYFFAYLEDTSGYLNGLQTDDFDMTRIGLFNMSAKQYQAILIDFNVAACIVRNYGDESHTKAQIYDKHGKSLSENDYKKKSKVYMAARRAEKEWKAVLKKHKKAEMKKVKSQIKVPKR